MREYMTGLYGVFGTNIHLKAIVGGLLTFAGFFVDLLLAKIFLILLVLTFIDGVLGYYRALRDKRAIVSKLMRSYAWHFSGYTITASTLFMVANGMPDILFVKDAIGVLDQVALAFFVVHESISILEHLNELGIPLPSSIFANLRKIKGQIDEPIKDTPDIYTSNKKQV